MTTTMMYLNVCCSLANTGYITYGIMQIQPTFLHESIQMAPASMFSYTSPNFSDAPLPDSHHQTSQYRPELLHQRPQSYGEL